MADQKYQQQVQGYPLAPATIVPRSDEESAPTNYRSEQLMKKKKRTKCLASTAIFAILLAAAIVAIALIFFRVRTPHVRLRDVRVANDGNGTIRFSARVSIRNRNFGRYKIDSSVATIRAGNNNIVGQFVIPDARARARSTRRIFVVADLRSFEGNSGALPLRVEARVRGEVEFLRVFDRRRSTNLRCTMNINLSNNDVQGLRCN